MSTMQEQIIAVAAIDAVRRLIEKVESDMAEARHAIVELQQLKQSYENILEAAHAMIARALARGAEGKEKNDD